MKTGKDTSDPWPVFDTLASCSAITGIPKDRLRDWKRDGAPGFRGSRVYFGELLPWMMAKIFAPSEESNGLPPVITWEDVIAQQKFEERSGKLFEFEKLMAILRDALLPLRQFLIAMAPQLSSRCNPTDPVLAHKAIEKHVKQGMRMIADAERAKIKKP